VRYETTIPRQVGLAGSSAIIVATLRCLMEFYDVEIPIEAQPTFVLLVEQEELGIAVGLQDRVIQVYEGLVYMDFDPGREHRVAGLRCFFYEPMDPASLPPLYIAHHETLGEPTEVFHSNIRERFNRGDAEVVGAMRRFADLAEEGRQALLARDADRLAGLINANFDTRRSIYRLPQWQIDMVETARAAGASAKFAGSGGAIVGTCDGDEKFERVRASLAAIGCRTIRPQV
jgi:glucuronokinase